VAILAALPATSPATTLAGVPALTAADPWPLVEHQGGAYAAFQSDLAVFDRTGLTLDLTTTSPTPVTASFATSIPGLSTSSGSTSGSIGATSSRPHAR
jgi:hypothetical protein